jgi:hypothetical protein
LEGPGEISGDLSLQTKFNRAREGRNLEFRAGFINLMNQANLGGPRTALNSGSSGGIAGTGGARVVQFAFRYGFQ